jgi:hypothetical protein
LACFVWRHLSAIHLCWPYHAILVPDRLNASSRSLPSRFGYHPNGWCYIVPEASHPAIAGDACSGKIPMTAHRVVSSPRHNSSSSDFMSHNCNTTRFSWCPIILRYAPLDWRKSHKKYIAETVKANPAKAMNIIQANIIKPNTLFDMTTPLCSALTWQHCHKIPS